MTRHLEHRPAGRTRFRHRAPRRYPARVVIAATAVLLALSGMTMAWANEPSAPKDLAESCPEGAVFVAMEDGTWRSCGTTTTPPATTSPSPTPTNANTPTNPPTTVPVTTAPSPRPSSTAAVRTIRAYITGYSYFDNTPPGSAAISNPVLHRTAGGTGTYEDPITVAVGHSISGGRDTLDWPAGTRFYLPNLRRYFLVEDACGDGGTPQNGPCHTGYPSGASTWLDVWTGGQGGSASAADRCMSAITKVSTVVVDPTRGYPVVSGDIYSTAGCSTQYGDAL